MVRAIERGLQAAGVRADGLIGLVAQRNSAFAWTRVARRGRRRGSGGSFNGLRLSRPADVVGRRAGLRRRSSKGTWTTSAAVLGGAVVSWTEDDGRR